MHHLRPADRDDLAAVVELYCRHEQRVRGAPDTDDGDVLGDWETPGWDYRTGSLLAEDDGRVVAYAVVCAEAADTVVDPDDHGLSERLLDWVEAHPGRLEHYTADAEPELGARLSSRGWRPARRFWRMRRELIDLPVPAWPAEVVVRDHDRPRDDVAVHALITSAFQEIGGQSVRSLEDWAGSLLRADRFQPSLCLVAESGGTVVGAALSQDLGDCGFVRQLAVAPPYRGRGLALGLLHECFRRHAARGLATTVLGVDAANPTGALQLYERAGMRVHEQFTRWDRPAPA